MIAKKVLNMGEKVLQTFSPMHQNIKNSKTKSQNCRFLNKRRGLLQKAAPPRLIEMDRLQLEISSLGQHCYNILYQVQCGCFSL